MLAVMELRSLSLLVLLSQNTTDELVKSRSLLLVVVEARSPRSG